MRVGKTLVYASHAAVPTPDNANFGIVYKYTGDGFMYIKTSDGVSTLIAGDQTQPYKSYIAQIAVSGGGAASATVLKNDLSAPIVWAKTTAGIIDGTLNGAFLSGKTHVMWSRQDQPTTANDTADSVISSGAYRASDNVIRIQNIMYIFTNSNLNFHLDIDTIGYIEIKVFP